MKTALAAPPARSAATPAPAPQQAQPAGPQQSSLSFLQTTLTGGMPLPPTTRQRMEKSFGHGFADVRVHTGGAAEAATTRFAAEALTTGPHVAFAPGRYQPDTPSGDRLLAHELTHVVQQRGSGGGIQPKSLVSMSGEPAEQAADSAADRVMAGKPAGISSGGLSLRGRILRRARLGLQMPSPVIQTGPGSLGAPRPGGGPLLTPVMTSAISPAGGRLTGAPPASAAQPGDAVPHTKAPDEAQTAAAEGGASPATVMVAGTPAGGPEQATGRRGQGKTKQEAGEKRREEAGEDQSKEGQEEAGGRRREGAGVRRTRRFGRDLGDRGAMAAGAAAHRLRARAGAMRVNEGAGSRIGAARAAAEPPANAAEAAGQRQQSASLQNAEIPAPDEAGARARSRAAVAANAPASIEDLDDFASGGGAATRDALTGTIAAEAQSQTAPVNQQLSAVGSPPPGPEPPAAVEQPEPMPAGGSAAAGLAAATPPPVPEDSLDASEFREEADSALAENDVDDATLERSEEGPLHEIGGDKRELNENVEAAAQNARDSEAAANDAAQGALAGAEMSTDGDMAARRALGQTAVSAEQEATRTGDQTGRQSLADRINQIYSGVEQEMTGKLSSLQTGAVQQFHDAQGQRLQDFTAGVRSDLSAFKERRYSGIIRGNYRRVRDWALGINDLPEVKELYERHRDQYIRDIDGLLAAIRAGIERTVTECKAALAAASREIETLAGTSRTALDAEAQAALTRARGQFRRMEANIESAARAANAALDRERQRAITEMDAALEQIRAENAGLAGRIAAAIRALAQLLGSFMRLLARITRMGIGAFLGAALDQAKSGVQNHLWGELQEAFKQWLFMKMPVIQLLLNMPPNLLEMLTTLASSIIGLFTENIPALLPAIGAAAMTWLAITLATKLIPGAGAIMAVIDAIRAAWALVQSLLSAAAAFFDFVMKVANRENGAVSFARALAFGIVAAVDAILTFLGVDALIRRVVSAIARPFQRIFGRIATRYRAFMARRRQRRGERRAAGRQRDRPGDSNRHRSAEGRARADRRSDRQRDAQRERSRERSQDPRGRRDSAEERRRRDRDRERERAERLSRAVSAVGPRIESLLQRGVSRIRLSAQLAFWRTRYRIRKLAIEGSGRQASVVAGNSPDRTVARIFRESPEGIYRMVHDIARERFRRAQRRGGLGQGGTPTIRPGDEPSQLAAGIQARPTAPGAGQTVPLQVGGTPVFGRQGSGSSQAARNNIVISGLGTYPEIVEKLASQGIRDRGIATAVSEALRTGRGSPDTMRLVAVLFGAEPARLGIASATSPLAMQAISGGVSGERVLGSPSGSRVQGDIFGASRLDPDLQTRTGTITRPGGGVFPASAVGAAPAGRRSEQTFAGGQAFRPDTNIARRSEADMLRTVELVYQAVRNMDFKDVGGLRREVLQLLEQFDRAAGVNP